MDWAEGTTLTIEPQHRFRNFSELKREAKGQYLEGRIDFQSRSPHLLSVGLRISLCGAEPSVAATCPIHPNRLFINRFKGKNRQKNLEPSCPLPNVDLMVIGKDVFWTAGSVQKIATLQGEPTQQYLNLKDLRLTVVVPTKAEIKSWHTAKADTSWQVIEAQLAHFYSTKHTKEQLQRIRVKVDIFSLTHGPSFDQLVVSLTSKPVNNKKSRVVGDLDLYEKNPMFEACCLQSKSVFLISKYPLPQGDKTRPRLVVWNPCTEEFLLETRLHQPDHVDIHNVMIMFSSPLQSEELVDQLHQNGYTIHIEAFRPSDGAASPTKIPFRYVTHTSPELPDRCIVCRAPLGHTAFESSHHGGGTQKRSHGHEDAAAVRMEKQARLDCQMVGSGRGGSRVQDLLLSSRSNPLEEYSGSSIPLAAVEEYLSEDESTTANDQWMTSTARVPVQLENSQQTELPSPESLSSMQPGSTSSSWSPTTQISPPPSSYPSPQWQTEPTQLSPSPLSPCRSPFSPLLAPSAEELEKSLDLSQLFYAGSDKQPERVFKPLAPCVSAESSWMLAVDSPARVQSQSAFNPAAQALAFSVGASMLAEDSTAHVQLESAVTPAAPTLPGKDRPLRIEAERAMPFSPPLYSYNSIKMDSEEMVLEDHGVRPVAPPSTATRKKGFSARQFKATKARDLQVGGLAMMTTPPGRRLPQPQGIGFVLEGQQLYRDPHRRGLGPRVSEADEQPRLVMTATSLVMTATSGRSDVPTENVKVAASRAKPTSRENVVSLMKASIQESRTPKVVEMTREDVATRAAEQRRMTGTAGELRDTDHLNRMTAGDVNTRENINMMTAPNMRRDSVSTDALMTAPNMRRYSVSIDEETSDRGEVRRRTLNLYSKQIRLLVPEATPERESLAVATTLPVVVKLLLLIVGISLPVLSCHYLISFLKSY